MKPFHAAAFAIVALMLGVLLSALAAEPPKPRRLLLPADLEMVCTPYEHGRSCKSAWEVRAFILGNARDDCSW